MFLLKDRLKLHFEKLGWTFKDKIDASTLTFSFDISQSGKTFNVTLTDAEMDRILASETYLRYWIEDVDVYYNRFLSLGGLD